MLVIDDEKAILAAYHGLLIHSPIDVDFACNFKEAVTLLSERNYNVVISDLRLSNNVSLDGLEILNLAKKTNPAIGFILVTACGSLDIRNRALDMGASYFLEKPVPLSDLRKLLLQMGVEL